MNHGTHHDWKKEMGSTSVPSTTSIQEAMGKKGDRDRSGNFSNEGGKGSRRIPMEGDRGQRGNRTLANCLVAWSSHVLVCFLAVFSKIVY